LIVLGPTDPKQAPEGSLRNMILNDWQALGLEYEPNTGDNCVHASASPFEGLAERLNWLKADLTTVSLTIASVPFKIVVKLFFVSVSPVKYRTPSVLAPLLLASPPRP
jgi:hypothetical protein